MAFNINQTLDMSGNRITNVADPASGSDATNMSWVSEQLKDADTLPSVRYASYLDPEKLLVGGDYDPTAANVDLGASLFPPYTAFGHEDVQLGEGDFVLLRHQTLQQENGIYVVTNGAADDELVLSRAPFMVYAEHLSTGQHTYVEGGHCAKDVYYLTTDGPFVIGVTALVFEEQRDLDVVPFDVVEKRAYLSLEAFLPVSARAEGIHRYAKDTNKLYRLGADLATWLPADSVPIRVTHAEALALKASASFIPGQYYTVTDYVCTHFIPHTDTLNTESSAYTTTAEELTVIAMSSSQLSTTATSQLYPHDEVTYEVGEQLAVGAPIVDGPTGAVSERDVVSDSAFKRPMSYTQVVNGTLRTVTNWTTSNDAAFAWSSGTLYATGSFDPLVLTASREAATGTLYRVRFAVISMSLPESTFVHARVGGQQTPMVSEPGEYEFYVTCGEDDGVVELYFDMPPGEIVAVTMLSVQRVHAGRHGWVTKRVDTRTGNAASFDWRGTIVRRWKAQAIAANIVEWLDGEYVCQYEFAPSLQQAVGGASLPTDGELPDGFTLPATFMDNNDLAAPTLRLVADGIEIVKPLLRSDRSVPGQNTVLPAFAPQTPVYDAAAGTYVYNEGYALVTHGLLVYEAAQDAFLLVDTTKYVRALQIGFWLGQPEDAAQEAAGYIAAAVRLGDRLWALPDADMYADQYVFGTPYATGYENYVVGQPLTAYGVVNVAFVGTVEAAPGMLRPGNVRLGDYCDGITLATTEVGSVSSGSYLRNVTLEGRNRNLVSLHAIADTELPAGGANLLLVQTNALSLRVSGRYPDYSSSLFGCLKSARFADMSATTSIGITAVDSNGLSAFDCLFENLAATRCSFMGSYRSTVRVGPAEVYTDNVVFGTNGDDRKVIAPGVAQNKVLVISPLNPAGVVIATGTIDSGGITFNWTTANRLVLTTANGELVDVPFGTYTPGGGSDGMGIWTFAGEMQADVKNFNIQHPTKPDKRLVHSTLEGPEVGVYYRGIAETDSRGYAVVSLPAYFEALTHPQERTVHITPVVETGGELPMGASAVADGAFTAYTLCGQNAQAFSWEVKAMRADQPAFFAAERVTT